MTLFERIVADLKETPYFKEFTFRKKGSNLSLKKPGMRLDVGLRHYFPPFYNENDELQIYPGLSVRFDILHKWFQKFSVKDIVDQRTGWSVCSPLSNYGFEQTFYFSMKEEKYDEEFKRLYYELVSGSEQFFPQFKNLKDYYDRLIEPILYGNAKLPVTPSYWIFEYLTACLLVAPENYPWLKEILLAHAEFLQNRKEPNIGYYYDRLDEILDYLEHYDFTKELAKLNS